MAKYTPTIGIECHVQLKTSTKLFASVGNDARSANPNTLISHICVGMPGALPYLNEKAVELSAKTAFALNTVPQKFSKFDRKHYFYPDLPKGYQISQYEHPIILGGHVDILVDGKTKKIGITRAHLEEDAGKNTHPEGADYSLVDLNRAGTPLLEIVSEPDINSPAEAKAYARGLYLLMKYAGISDCDLYHGNMRFDVNISISKDSNLGIRSEVKNLNSFKSVENAVAYEIKRQTELLDKDEVIVQETRGWDDAKQKTTSQRGKEEAHDYRYMPEPDVPPIELSEEYINKLKKNLPIMPMKWREILNGLNLDKFMVETLIDAEAGSHEAELGEKVSYLGRLKRVFVDKDFARYLVNRLVNFEIPLRMAGYGNGQTVKTFSEEDTLKVYKGVYELIKAGKLNSTNADTYERMLFQHNLVPDDFEQQAHEWDYIQVSDEGEIEEIVKKVISENQNAAEDINKGEMRAIGFLVGQVMAKSKGKANPELAQKIIKQQLGIL